MIKKTIFALNSMEMKKYFALLICILALNGCDDGDMTFDSFDFSTVTATSCPNNNGNLVFKINGNEALILQIGEAFPFRNVIGEREYTIGTTNRVFYRTFSGTVPSTYFCSTIPPTTPTVTAEWSTPTASSGKIKIVTTLVPGGTTMDQATYNHSIVFENITFTNDAGENLIYETLSFGVYETSSNVKFLFGQVPVQKCSTGRLFRIFDTNIGNETTRQNLNEVIEINLPESYLPTTDETKRVFISEAAGIRAIYKIYNDDLSPASYCAGPTVDLYEQWVAEDGSDEVLPTDDLGYFEIIRTTINSVPTYQINIRQMKFSRTAPAPETGTLVATFTVANSNFGDYIVD